MIRRSRRFAAAVLGLSVVAMAAGCSNDRETGAGWAAAGGALKAAFAARSAPPPSGPPPLTAAQVDETPMPLLLLTVQSDNRGAVLYRTSTNSGTETFSTADKITVTLRDGVLISTRGLVPDLMSAAVPSARQIAQGQGSHRRSYQVLDGLDQTVSRVFDCSLSRGGSETLTIAGRSHATRIVEEACTSPEGSINNGFWIDGRGKIRQSTQSTGTSVGFLRLSDPSK
jgi:hypothetical protein